MNSREFEFLLCCLRSDPDEDAIKRLATKDIDWAICLERAAQHGVRPILFRTLKSACWTLVPEAIQIELVRFTKANAQKNLILTGELLRLADIFAQHSIQVAAFKGPVLAASVYGDLSLREFSDLDIIIPDVQLSKAEDILTGLGYHADFPDRKYRSAFLRYQGQYAFRHPSTGISVDLHWRLSSKGIGFPIESGEIWSRLREIQIGGRTIFTLTDDDLALFLAAHGTKEGWRDLIWLCDFAALLRNCNVDWGGVFAKAQEARLSRPFLLAIFLAFSLLHAPAPAELVEKAMNNSAVKSLAQNAQLRMLRALPATELGEFLINLNTYDRLRDRLWPVVALLTTRTVGDYEAMPLPKILWSTYYLTRPFRLGPKILRIMLSPAKPV